MKITRSPLIINAEHYSREYRVERSEGCHVMPIVEYLAQVQGYEKKYDDGLRKLQKDPNQLLELYRTWGYVWEHSMTREATYQYVKRGIEEGSIFEPGEQFWCQKCDVVMEGYGVAREHIKTRGKRHRGLFATPDIVFLRPCVLGEMKFTWRSAGRTSETDMVGMWKWKAQLMSYAWMLGLTGAKLLALFCMGDYKPGAPKPMAYQFDVVFSQKELHWNWQRNVMTARSLGWL